MKTDKFGAVAKNSVATNSRIHKSDRIAITKDDASGLFNATSPWFTARSQNANQVLGMIDDAIEELSESLSELKSARNNLIRA